MLEDYREINMLDTVSRSPLEYSQESQDTAKFSDDTEDGVLNWKERALQLEKGRNYIGNCIFV